MWSFRKSSRVPIIPDDREELERAQQRADSHVATAQEIRAEVLPVAREVAFHLEKNHFAEKVKKSYRLRGNES